MTWNEVMQSAPGEFDQSFLRWLRQLEEHLLVKFADWLPSPADEVQRYATAINQPVPSELKLFYDNAYPFGLLRNGWHKWPMREEEYRTVWYHSLVEALGIESDEARRLIDASPPLWPIYCLESKRDTVGFVWKNDEIAIIELSLSEKRGEGKPVAIGLRNYFLVNIALELLAEDQTEVDFGKLRQRPEILELSGWPREALSPKHIALVI